MTRLRAARLAATRVRRGARAGRAVITGSAGLLAIGALSAATVVAAGPASAGTSIMQLRSHGLINYEPRFHAVSRTAAAAAPRTTLPGGLPVFTARQTDPRNGHVFHYTMVGKNPKAAQTRQSTTVATKLIPLKIVLADGTAHNPAKTNRCDSVPALTRTVKSPVFVKQDWSFHGTHVGTTQYADAFRRAEVWKYTQPSGLNPRYHVYLSLARLRVITVHIPTSASAKGKGSCSGEIAINIHWLTDYLTTTLLPKLAAHKLVGPATFPLFLVTNTVEYAGSPIDCCILGYHGKFTTARGNTQTFGVADYENSGFFPRARNLRNVESVSHEVAEWMDDPLGNNPTPQWGDVGQVSGCQANLEVGDPLTGTTLSDPVGGFTYSLQELAFASWFYHQSPSIGLNGWYSNNGTFTTAAARCT